VVVTSTGIVGVGSEFRRITPLLRRQGITIEREKVGKDRTRILSLKQA